MAFCATYALAQLSAIASGLRAPDHAFGFQMFGEASSIRFELKRKLKGKRKLVPVVGDSWEAPDARGELHRIHWRDRVRYPVLEHSGRTRHASYGLAGQLDRLQRALDDFMAHLQNDTQTQALIAVVHASYNGRPERELQLSGRRRR